ncbi:MAG: diheme cytochrome c-553 [Acidobacteriota bacterium]|nr:diheme cytochrome c-553 [Acidobacteriota bacterium]
MTGVRVKVALVVSALFAAASFGVAASGPAAPRQMAKAEMVKRGEHLVKAIGCGDCHTPMKMGPDGPEADTALYLSGHRADEKLPPPPAASGPWIVSITEGGTAWAGPWGISYTQNLTPDKETGLGNYTEDQFVMTIREGKKQGRGRALLPPMPWQAFRHLSDEDLKSIFAYLQTVKPIANKVPDPVIADMK